jgi:aspartyl/asparaginyl beta-hydroxylase (cupin superfamily)
MTGTGTSAATPDMHVQELLDAAKSRIDANDPAAARSLLERAARASPRDINVLMLTVVACRMQRDNAAALQAASAALAVDPYHYVAHLSKGAALEEMGQSHAAAESYRAALIQAPAKSRIPAALQTSMAHAERMVREDAERLHAHLSRAVAAERARYPQAALRRFDECLEIFSGMTRPYVHQPSLLHFPQLPAITFYDESLFPWLPRLEQGTEAVRAELEAVIREDWGTFHPYIQYPEGAPLRQWKALNQSPAWSAFDLWRDGKRFEANCARCPYTAALLAELPVAAQEGYGPSAMFSVLAPRTRIPPHTGSTNLRLIVHLPLILPPRCRFRVGNETREWRQGKAWVFDDTIEHEAWNDSDETRVILMFDVWNPLVSEVERALTARMMEAMRHYR